MILTLIVGLSFGFIFFGESDEDQKSLSEESTGTIIFAWTCIVMQPIAIAIGAALTRSMRKLDKNTISVYLNLFQLVTYLALVVILGLDAAKFS